MVETAVDLQGARILVVDDVPANLDVLCQALEAAAYKVEVATDGRSALEIATESSPELILMDVVMPGLDGFETCRRLQTAASTRDIPVLFLTAKGETEEIVEGFQAGGGDYIVKPFQKEEVLIRVRTHLERARLKRELVEKNRALEEEIRRRQSATRQRNHLAEKLVLLSQREAERWGLAGLVGQSRTMQQILEKVNLLQSAPTVSVLLTGESGTGKELIARAIHGGSARGEGPFVAVNCAAVPAELAESLFFGHVKGAFTGAEVDHMGYFELAHGGTLFLDEIGEMPAAIQPKLLRVLEDGRLTPVGGQAEQVVEVRIIAATNADLEAQMAGGAFRRDLYYRLAQFAVPVPPLRQRPEDIPLLAQHFLTLLAAEMSLQPPSLSPQALKGLQAYDFPGNVRELKNLIERALLESRGGEIRPEHLHFAHVPSIDSDRPAPALGVSPEQVPFDLDEAEVFLTRRALEQAGGNVAAAARLLGTNRNRLYRILARADQGEAT